MAKYEFVTGCVDDRELSHELNPFRRFFQAISSVAGQENSQSNAIEMSRRCQFGVLKNPFMGF